MTYTRGFRIRLIRHMGYKAVNRYPDGGIPLSRKRYTVTQMAVYNRPAAYSKSEYG